MAATIKTPNYTTEQEAALTEAWIASPTKETINAFAAKFGKSTRSIIAKLSRSGLYTPQERKAKDGGAVVSKEELASQIGGVIGMNENDTSSLAKANKQALKMLLEALQIVKAGSPDAVGIDE